MLKERKFLYSSYVYYNDNTIADILNNELLCEINETDSSFTVFIAESGCSKETKELVGNYAANTINHLLYKTIPFDFYHHLNKIDSIISDDSCSVWFDPEGTLLLEKNVLSLETKNLFFQSLSDILKNIFPK